MGAQISESAQMDSDDEEDRPKESGIDVLLEQEVFEAEVGKATQELEEVALRVDPGSPQVTCLLCSKEANQPCESKPCGHRYCRDCIYEALLINKTCPECHVVLTEYSLVAMSTGLPLKAPEVTTIFGTTFVQFGRVGLESFHFSKDRCFVRFETQKYPEMNYFFDNGEALPITKDFENWSFNPETRKFVGTIRWGDSTVQGSALYQYEMVFDAGYEFIQGGTCTAKGNDNIVHMISKFGDSLLYGRLRTSIYSGDYVVDLNALQSWPWVVRIVLRLVAWFLGKVYNVPPWVSMELLHRKTTVRSLGRGSFHFNRAGSHIDNSKLASQPDFPAKVPFIRETFDEQSRIFEGIADFNVYWGQYKLQFDEGFENILGGTTRFFQVPKTKNVGDILSEKYDNTVSSKLVFVGEDKFGSEVEGDDSRSKIQYRLVQPWQSRS